MTAELMGNRPEAIRRPGAVQPRGLTDNPAEPRCACWNLARDGHQADCPMARAPRPADHAASPGADSSVTDAGTSGRDRLPGASGLALAPHFDRLQPAGLATRAPGGGAGISTG